MGGLRISAVTFQRRRLGNLLVSLLFLVYIDLTVEVHACAHHLTRQSDISQKRSSCVHCMLRYLHCSLLVLILLSHVIYARAK